MESIVIVTIALVVSLLLADLFHYFKSSKIIGLMIAGIILANPFFKPFISDSTITNIAFMSSLGIVFLMFITGLEIDYKKLKKKESDEIKISLMSAFLPFILGFIFIRLLGFNNLTAFTVGAALSISSEAATAIALMEIDKIKSKLGTIMLGAGIIDDFIGIMFLSIILIITQGGSAIEFALFPLKIILFVVIVVLTFKFLLPRLIKHSITPETIRHNSGNVLSLVIILGFIIASLSSIMGLGQVIGAFIAGIIIQMIIKNKAETEAIVSEIKDFSFAVIIPFFFINIGLNFQILAVLDNFKIFIMLLTIAIIGKLLGSLFVKPFTKLKTKQLALIGWGLNSRGAIELIIIEIARNAGLINSEIYSSLVMVAILTTFLFPFIVRSYIKKWPQIMNN